MTYPTITKYINELCPPYSLPALSRVCLSQISRVAGFDEYILMLLQKILTLKLENGLGDESVTKLSTSQHTSSDVPKDAQPAQVAQATPAQAPTAASERPQASDSGAHDWN
jgi:hypothetical protein